MKILLDENFPLDLLRSLLADGQHAEHIITLGWRGASDQRIRERLLDRDVLFLTRDEDFLFDKPSAAVVVLSRVRQGRRLAERVEIWRLAIREIGDRSERRFELMDVARSAKEDRKPNGASREGGRLRPRFAGASSFVPRARSAYY